MHLLAERFIIFFGIMIVGFFEGVVTTYRMAQMSPLANFFSVFTSIVYGYTVVEWLELWMTYPLVGWRGAQMARLERGKVASAHFRVMLSFAQEGVHAQPIYRQTPSPRLESWWQAMNGGTRGSGDSQSNESFLFLRRAALWAKAANDRWDLYLGDWESITFHGMFSVTHGWDCLKLFIGKVPFVSKKLQNSIDVRIIFIIYFWILCPWKFGCREIQRASLPTSALM